MKEKQIDMHKIDNFFHEPKGQDFAKEDTKLKKQVAQVFPQITLSLPVEMVP